MLNWLEKESAISWVIVLCLAVFIFYISSLTFVDQPAKPKSQVPLSFIYHFTIFFLFALFLMIALAKGKNINLLFIPLIAAIIYGISDEIHQIFVPGRTASVYDVMINSFGIFYAFIIYAISLQYREIKNGKNSN